MRTSIVGLCKRDVAQYATDICRLTHYDPRCVGSCVVISMLIHSLVYGRELKQAQLYGIGETYDARISDYLTIAFHGDLEELNLDDASMGYTLKTMAAAIWTLYHSQSFEEGLLTIVNAGGDADTNAAVACALLGAKYGYSAISHTYIDGLVRKEYLKKTADEVIMILIDENLCENKACVTCSYTNS